MTLARLWKRWPKSPLLQAPIALMLATILAVITFLTVVRVDAWLETSRDAQNGLGAFIYGQMAAAFVEFFGTVALFVFQYRGTRRLNDVGRDRKTRTTQLRK